MAFCELQISSDTNSGISNTARTGSPKAAVYYVAKIDIGDYKSISELVPFVKAS